MYIQPALAANPNVTFLSATGDDGSDFGTIYPSASPEVVGVGGTSLFVNGQNQWIGETGWSGGGGGYSAAFTQPAFQQNDGFSGNNGQRTDPDVSAIADPDTGVAVYDSFDFGKSTPWDEVGGTSLATPVWASILAIADQGRVIAGGQDLGSVQSLNALYGLPSTDFHDITQGNTGLYSAGVGYDLVSGIGSPKADLLIPQLAAAGLATHGVIAIQPPTSVIAGGHFGLVAQAVSKTGVVDPSFSGTATISLVNGPAGTTFTPVTVNVTQGTAIFDGLTLSHLSNGTNYQFSVVLSGFPTQTLTPNPVNVATGATPGVGVYYPLPIDTGLRNDITKADADKNDATDDLFLVYSQSYDIAAGAMVLSNTSGLPNKTIAFLSHDEFATTAPVIDGQRDSRLFEIEGGNGGLSVIFQGLAQGMVLQGGLARDDGGLTDITGAAAGGAFLINGGAVSLTGITLKNNEALGKTGAQGTSGGSATSASGGPGKVGLNAKGGAIYVAAGSLTLNDDVLTGNLAHGGAGGQGGTGGEGYATTTFGFFREVYRINGGPGGTGGMGGVGAGGALFLAGGTVSLSGGTMSGNSAVGGSGGAGGQGGHAGYEKEGGAGGLGGNGGVGQGGGIYLQKGTLSLNLAAVNSNVAVGGVGGAGGHGGTGTFSGLSSFSGPGGQGGNGGLGGNGGGGGLYVTGGSLSVNSSTIDNNSAMGGAGGVFGYGAPGTRRGSNGADGASGTGAGGGLYDPASLTLTNAAITGNSADNGGGIYAKGTLTLTSSTITDNTAGANGGGIDINGIVFVNQSELADNVAVLGGGLYTSGTFTINGGELLDNSATQSGGGIYSTGKGTIAGTDVNGNTATLGGGVYNTAIGGVTLTSATIENNSASIGGGIFGGSSVQVTGGSFVANSATNGNGGAIYQNKGSISATGVLFQGNSGADGGAIASGTGTVTITGGSFIANSVVNGFGGAIASTSTLTISGVLFQNNSAVDGVGGAIFEHGSLTVKSGSVLLGNLAGRGAGIAISGKLSLANSTMSSNSAGSTSGGSAMGGAIYETSGTVAISGGKIVNNFAGDSGGGIFVKQGALTIASGTALNSNSADGDGGAVYNSGGTVSLTNLTIGANSANEGGAIGNHGTLTANIVTFSGNSASNGGAIANFIAGTATLTDATLSGNSAGGSGGAIANVGTMTITSSTIADNTGAAGGGIQNKSGTLTAINVTIAENSATTSNAGGGLDVTGGTVNLYNTIVAENTFSTSTTASDIAGNVSTSSSYNLIGTGGSGGLTDSVNNNLVGRAADLGPLGFYGGPTQTIPLLTGSPAIDAGGNLITGITVPTSDERDALRGGTTGLTGLNAGLRVDIGAFEASSSYLVTTTTDAVAYGTLPLGGRLGQPELERQ